MANHASSLLVFMLGVVLGLPSHADMGVGLSAHDFRLDSEGQVVVIDPNGSELYLDYIGDPRTEPEKIKVTIDDPDIKIMSGKQCAIKNPSRDCKIVLRYKNIKNPSYGQKTLSVLNSKDSLIKEYVIWVKPHKGEEEIQWKGTLCKYTVPVILQNSTQVTGTYRWMQTVGWINPALSREISGVFNLPAKSVCYIDI